MSENCLKCSDRSKVQGFDLCTKCLKQRIYLLEDSLKTQCVNIEHALGLYDFHSIHEKMERDTRTAMRLLKGDE